MGFAGGSDGKEPACNAGDLSSIPELGRSPGEGNGNPLQYCCLENSMDRGPWDFPGKNTGVVAISFSRGSFLLRDCICVLVSPVLAGGFFTTAPPRDTLRYVISVFKSSFPFPQYRKACQRLAQFAKPGEAPLTQSTIIITEVCVA